MTELIEKPATLAVEADYEPLEFGAMPKTTRQAMKLAEFLAMSQLIPECFRGKPADIMIAMMRGQRLGLFPITCVDSMAVINGRACMWGDAMLGTIKNCPLFEDIEETFNADFTVATCKVKRQGQKTPVIQTFSKAFAVTAGLWGNRVWAKYPQRMLQMRARGFALRDAFPDVLCGLITREEAEDYPKEKMAETSNQPTQVDNVIATLQEKNNLTTDDLNIEEILND